MMHPTVGLGLPALLSRVRKGQTVQMRIVGSAAMVLLVSVLAGCGGADGESSNVETTELVASGRIDIDLEPVLLPDDFPADVPLPAQLVLLDANVRNGATNDLFNVTGWYDGEAVQAADQYVALLEERGYEVTSTAAATNSLFVIAVGPDWFVSAGFFPDPVRLEGTSIGMTVGPASASPVTASQP